MGSETIHALESISINIDKGEYVAFMGPSGSGKSTLMNIIGCLDTVSSGTYILNNNDVSDLTENELAEIRNKEIGFVFQTFKENIFNSILTSNESLVLHVSNNSRRSFVLACDDKYAGTHSKW